MKNKKLTSIFLGALISLSIVGCNKVNNSSHSNNESSFNSDSSITSSYIDDGKMNENKWKSIFTANNFTNLKGNQLLETSYVLGDNKESPIRTINNSKKENFDYTSSYLRNEFDYETQTISITSNDFHTYYLNSSDKSLDESTSFKAYADNLASSLKGVAKQTNEGYQINVSFASNPTEYYYLTKKSDLVVGILYSEKLAQYVYGEYIFKETNSYNLIQSLFNVYSISNFYKDITYLEDKGCYQLPTDTLSKAFKYGKKFIGDYAYIYIKNNKLDSLSFSSRLEDGNTTNIKINITGYGEATVITPTNKIECPHKYTSFKKTDNFHYYQCDLCNVVTEYVGHRYQDGVCRDCAYIETKPNEIKCPICDKLLVTLHESTATKKVISADFDDVTFTHDSATNSDIGISTVHNCNVKIIKTTEEGLIDPDCLCSIRDVNTYKIYKNNTDLVKEFAVESNITEFVISILPLTAPAINAASALNSPIITDFSEICTV